MKFRVRHLLYAMVFVALWLPVSRWLLDLEAMDHPNKPQTIADIVGFYVGSTVLVGMPLAGMAWVIEWRVRQGRGARRSEASRGST